MVALLAPRPGIDTARGSTAVPADAGTHTTPDAVGAVQRPALRVIDGGRSAAGRAAMVRTYRRRRVAALVIALVLLAVGVRVAQAGLDAAAGWAGPGSAPIEGPTVVVEAERGDTLWTIARRVHPERDVRPVVDAMLADRGTTAVDVGDSVVVPAG